MDINLISERYAGTHMKTSAARTDATDMHERESHCQEVQAHVHQFIFCNYHESVGFINSQAVRRIRVLVGSYHDALLQ